MKHKNAQTAVNGSQHSWSLLFMETQKIIPTTNVALVFILGASS